MTKQEFLDELRQALSGKVAAGVITENLRFYEDYINTEMRKGKSEEEVLAALGDARLLAKTIAETSADARDQSYDGAKGEAYEGQEETLPQHRSSIPGWVWLIIFVVIVVAVLSFAFKVLMFFAPVIIIGAVVMFLVKRFRG